MTELRDNKQMTELGDNNKVTGLSAKKMAVLGIAIKVIVIIVLRGVYICYIYKYSDILRTPALVGWLPVSENYIFAIKTC